MFGQPSEEVKRPRPAPELNSEQLRPITAVMFDERTRSELPARRVWRDRVALVALAVTAGMVAAFVNVHARLHHWADRHEPYDPFVLLPVAVGLAVLTVAYLVATRRRLRREVAIRQEREGALTQALLKIEVLSGLLAMCASCKRIRSEDGRWEPVEAYLERHGEVSVSHGLCPGCTGRLYPEYADALN